MQQKLMRHAQVATTMNVYGNALMTTKREANSKVVQMALRPELKVAKRIFQLLLRTSQPVPCTRVPD
jgi:hypothetical protein